MESLRNEMNFMRQQINYLSESLESKIKVSCAPHMITNDSEKKKEKKSSKLTKLFVDQPTPLRQFLKQLGYEVSLLAIDSTSAQ